MINDDDCQNPCPHSPGSAAARMGSESEPGPAPAPSPPTFLRAPPRGRARVPPLLVTCGAGRVGRAAPSGVLPQAPGRRGFVAGQLCRASPTAPRPLCSLAAPRATYASAGDQGKGECGGSRMGPAGRALRLPGIVWAGAARTRAHPSPSPPAARPRLQRGGGKRMTAGRRGSGGEGGWIQRECVRPGSLHSGNPEFGYVCGRFLF